MECYHCLFENPNTKLLAVGVCKKCQVGACIGHGHGEMCQICGFFHCSHHQSDHQKDPHKIRSLRDLPASTPNPFPNTTRYSIKASYQFLNERKSEEPLLAINHGIELAKKFSDREMQTGFEKLRLNIMGEAKQGKYPPNSDFIKSMVKRGFLIPEHVIIITRDRLVENAKSIGMDPRKL